MFFGSGKGSGITHGLEIYTPPPGGLWPISQASSPARWRTYNLCPASVRYTAGAIASIAFDCRAPILDGNVIRVLCRVYNIDSDPRMPETRARLWELAEEILPPQNCSDFNSGLMELGATVCIPRQPRCLACPIRQYCRAFAAGTQNAIPAPRKARPTPESRRWTICVQHKHHWLIEQRPATGRWANLWQFPTIEAQDGAPTSNSLPFPITAIKQIGEVRHALTHRRYIFTAFIAAAKSKTSAPGKRWIDLKNLSDFPLSRPQLKIADMLRQL